jgi:hypothetical protein
MASRIAPSRTPKQAQITGPVSRRLSSPRSDNSASRSFSSNSPAASG